MKIQIVRLPVRFTLYSKWTWFFRLAIAASPFSISSSYPRVCRGATAYAPGPPGDLLDRNRTRTHIRPVRRANDWLLAIARMHLINFVKSYSRQNGRVMKSTCGLHTYWIIRDYFFNLVSLSVILSACLPCPSSQVNRLKNNDVSFRVFFFIILVSFE